MFRSFLKGLALVSITAVALLAGEHKASAADAVPGKATSPTVAVREGPAPADGQTDDTAWGLLNKVVEKVTAPPSIGNYVGGVCGGCVGAAVAGKVGFYIGFTLGS